LPQDPSEGLENTEPNKKATKNEFSQSGALCALGMINAFRNKDDVNQYLMTKLDDSTSETLIYGICAGLGLSSGLSHDREIVEKLKISLFADQTMPGFMASMGIGLVMAGSGLEGQEEFSELLEYSIETKHEKIILGCGLGLAMIVAQKPEAFPLGETNGTGEPTDFSRLVNHIEPYVRLSAVNCIASAYVGNNNSLAIFNLLKLISNDVSQIVRRGATIALGFVLCNHQAHAIELIEPLLVHHCQHIRFGACIALGICFASTGNTKVLQMLKPLQLDMFAYVKQAAAIGAGMILNSQNDSTCSQYGSFQQWIYNSNLSDESQIMKFGSIIALGLMNAGGQNMNLSLFSNLGMVSTKKLAAMLIFSHYWYWYPFVQYLGLALETSEVILMSEQLDVLSAKLETDLPKSSRAYLKRFKASRSRENETVHEAVLSFVKNRTRPGSHFRSSRHSSANHTSSMGHRHSGPSSAKKEKVSSRNAGDAKSSKTVESAKSATKGEKSAEIKEPKRVSEKAPHKDGSRSAKKQSSPSSSPSDFLIENMSRVLPVHCSSLKTTENIVPMRSLARGRIVICTKPDGGQMKTLFNALNDYPSELKNSTTTGGKTEEINSTTADDQTPKSFTFDSTKLE